MSRRKTPSIRPLSDPPTCLYADVEMVAQAVVAEAERAVDGAVAVLRRAGLFGKGAPTQRVPESFLLKLAACMRIYEWEQAKLIKHLPAGLPSSAEVWKDLLNTGGAERFPGRELARQVFFAWFRHMAWTTPLVPRCDVVVGGIRGEGVIDELAELLVKFRHLVEQPRPGGPEEK